MKRAVIFGSAECLPFDYYRLLQWQNYIMDKATVFAVNYSAYWLPCPVRHIVSLHADILPKLQQYRWEKYREWPYLWSAKHILANRPEYGQLKIDNWIDYKWDGTSSALAHMAAQSFHFDKILLAGVPMDNSPHFYGSSFVASEDSKPGWVANAHTMTNVRSMSGWTAQLLGQATPQWWLEE